MIQLHITDLSGTERTITVAPSGTLMEAIRDNGFPDLLAACGIGNPEMARILYASATGMQALQDTARDTAATAIGSLVDLILALR